MEKAKKMLSSKKVLSVFLAVLLVVMTLMSAGSALASSSKSFNVKKFSVSSYTNTTITLKWNKVSGANGYVIEKYNSSKKKWTTTAKIKKGTKTSYKVKKLSAVKKYKFRIRAYKKSGQKLVYSPKAKTLTTYTSPAKPKNFRVKSVNMNSVTFAWKKVSKAKGYKIQQLVDGKWKDVKKINKVKTVSATINGLNPGSTYDFRIVAYKTVGRKTYNSPAASLVVTTYETPVIGSDSPAAAPSGSVVTTKKDETTASVKPNSSNNNATEASKPNNNNNDATEAPNVDNTTESTKATTATTEPTTQDKTNENGEVQLPIVWF